MSRLSIRSLAVAAAAFFPLSLFAGYAACAEPAQENAQQNAPQFKVKNEFKGKISNVQTKSVEKAERTIATLKLDKGEQVMVDLGKPDETKNLDLKDGDEITVSGPLARFADEFAIVADQIQCNGKTVDIDRRLHNVSGDVTAVQYTALLVTEEKGKQTEAAGTTHLLAALTDKEGQKTWVDFGPGRNLEELKIQPGDQLSVDGVITGFQEGDVLVAHDIQKGNQKITVDWIGGQSSGQKEQSSGQGEKSQGQEK